MTRIDHRVCLLLLALAPGPGLGADEVANVEPYCWSFRNFSSDHCSPPAQYFTWERYRETYIGIPPGPSVNNGFDWLFFDKVYEQELGTSGNCFGLSLMSLQINEKGGHLGFCAPVGQYSGDSFGAPPLDDAECDADEDSLQMQGPTDPFLRRAIEETHGHQVNLAAVRYTIELISEKKTTGGQAYADVLANAPVLINLIRDVSEPFGAGHTMLAYRAQEVNGEKRIYVYDPNRTLARNRTLPDDHPMAQLGDQREWYEKGDNFIRVFNDGSWEFRFAGWNTVQEHEDDFDEIEAVMWPQGEGLISTLPLSIVGPRDRNPASMGLSVTSLLSKIFLSGSGATLEQVVAPGGKFAFVPGTKKLELSPAKCLLEIFPFIASGGAQAWRGGKELYFAVEPPDGPRDYEIQTGRNGYLLEIATGPGTLSVRAHAASGGLDVLRVEDPATDEPKLMLFNDAGVDAYDVEFFRALRPDESTRAIRLKNVSMDENGLLDLRLDPGGEGILITSPLGDARFDVELSSTDGGETATASLEDLTLLEGATSLIRPEDWTDLQEETIVGGARILTAREIEAYEEIVYGGLSSGSIGPDFDDSRDLGGARDGQTSHDPASELYTQVSAGDGVGPEGDSLHFAYRRMRGDFELIVDIGRMDDPPAAGAEPGVRGLMARQTAAPDSRFSFLQTLASSAPDDWPRWSYRSAHGSAETFDDRLRFNYAPDQQPRFLKLVRRGRTFYGFVSRDSTVWEPIGSNTWYGLEAGAELLVGFASATGGAPAPAMTTFRVLRLGPIPNLPEPLPDDGMNDGQIIFETVFAGDDGAVPAGFRSQKREGDFLPELRGGRVQLVAEGAEASSTSLWSDFVLDDVDSAIYQFDFDLYLGKERPGDAGDGVTFVLAGGDELSAVGLSGDALGYEAMAQDPQTGSNRSRATSLAVEFDTWDSGPLATGYHVGIDSLNQVESLVETSEDLLDPFAAEGIHVTVVYNRGDVSVVAAARAGDQRQLLRAAVLPLSFSAETTRAVFGFTASTGAGRSLTAEVDNLAVREIACDDAQEVAEIIGTPTADVQLGGVVVLDGSASHAGPGDQATEAVHHLWEIVSGGAEIVGPDSGPTVNVRVIAPGLVVVRLTVDDDHCDNPASTEVEFTAGGDTGGNWLRCDCNGDGQNDITDPIADLRWMFVGDFRPPCTGACDCDGNRAFEITDAIFALSFQFLSGDPPPPPFPDCDSFPGCGKACAAGGP